MTRLHDCFFIKNRPKHLKRRWKEGKEKRGGRGQRKEKENEERRTRRRREGGGPSDLSAGLAITAAPVVCTKVAQISPEPEKKWFPASPTPTPPRFLQTQGTNGESYTIQHLEKKKRKHIKIHVHTQTFNVYNDKERFLELCPKLSLLRSYPSSMGSREEAETAKSPHLRPFLPMLAQ